MSDVCGHLSGGLKFLNNFLPQSRGSSQELKKKNKKKKAKNALFRIFFDPYEPPFKSNHH